MAEILTESFCERCGTRYTFESTAPRKRLGSFRTLSRGLKNFVLSDDTSLDDALAAARSDVEREATSQQLDAFHKTFNFCMSCRQYTCANCWNEVEGRCLTCTPHLGHEILPAPFPDLAVGEFGNGHVEQPSANGHAREELEVAWPTSDLEQIAPAEDVLPEQAREPIETGPGESAEVEPVAAEPAEAEAVDVEPVVAGPAEAQPAEVEPVAVEGAGDAVETVTPESPAAVDAEPVISPAPSATRPTSPRRRQTPGTVEDRAAAAAAATADLLARFRPGQSIDAALDAFEAEQARREADASAGAPLDALPTEAPAPDEVAVERAEPPAAPPTAPEPEPTPVLADESAAVTEAAATLDPVAEPAEATESPAAAAPPDDRVEVPSWRIVAPEQQPRAADGHPAERPVPSPQVPQPAPEWPAVPQWPARPEEPGGIAAILAARSAAGGSSDALWAASSQEVIAPPSPAAASTGVQSCISCGLSLSATARFCRRCGTRQGG